MPIVTEKKKLPHGAGIYCIRCVVNDKKYVGQTSDLQRRKRDHLGLLRSKKHHSKKLQSDFNKYGEDAFEFYVLERCQVYELIRKEVDWIRKLMSEYNLLENTGGVAGGYTMQDKKDDNFFATFIKYVKKEDRDANRPLWHLWVYGGQKQNEMK